MIKIMLTILLFFVPAECCADNYYASAIADWLYRMGAVGVVTAVAMLGFGFRLETVFKLVILSLLIIAISVCVN